MGPAPFKLRGATSRRLLYLPCRLSLLLKKQSFLRGTVGPFRPNVPWDLTKNPLALKVPFSPKFIQSLFVFTVASGASPKQKASSWLFDEGYGGYTRAVTWLQ